MIEIKATEYKVIDYKYKIAYIWGLLLNIQAQTDKNVWHLPGFH